MSALVKNHLEVSTEAKLCKK